MRTALGTLPKPRDVPEQDVKALAHRRSLAPRMLPSRLHGERQQPFARAASKICSKGPQGEISGARFAVEGQEALLPEGHHYSLLQEGHHYSFQRSVNHLVLRRGLREEASPCRDRPPGHPGEVSTRRDLVLSGSCRCPEREC